MLESCCRTAPGARADIKRSLDQYYGLYDRIGMAAEPDRGDEAVEGYLSLQGAALPLLGRSAGCASKAGSEHARDAVNPSPAGGSASRCLADLQDRLNLV